jgi:small subunit ribosomal protein S17
MTKAAQETAQTKPTRVVREKQGKVVSAKMAKTVTVVITRRFAHPMYGKTVSRSKKYLAHDEKGQCKVGDMVRIVECRPLSKRKSWRVVQIVKSAVGE